MLKVTLTNEWFLIENKVLFGFTAPNEKYLNLAYEAWEDVITKQTECPIVEYPWEYDIKWMMVECFSGKENKLNYVIIMGDKKISIIQSPEILEDKEIGDMDYRLYMDDVIAKKINQLELEGNQIKLDRENWVTQIEVKSAENNQEIDISVKNTKGEDIEIEVE